ncbi:MAG: type IV secretory system conjugative DNA transfer family protein [Parvimonas sp.]|uniref:VirD4-like conjugal transfer protein, CD1115 family n=1 Tax=Parvimonas sp. TaxID=1944660 RepID=UPI0025E17A57|nr:type IV secretory system conjugative DNA transfer family protein [Parvimonas sp.]MCI5997041.1 type IV secretory system conjugative DNA transfer family protein [Parvimonas sp.]
MRKKNIKILKYNIKNLSFKNIVFFIINFMIFWFFFNFFSFCETFKGDFFKKLISAILKIENISFFPKTSILESFIYAIVVIVIFNLYFKSRKKNKKNYRQRIEYGSARWGTKDDIKPFINPIFSKNIILTQTEFLTMESRTKNSKYARNKNMLIIGGSGTGKTRYILKPNLMQAHSSYVVADSKGTVLLETGELFKKLKYKVKIFNLVNFQKSMKYNPFVYIKTEDDILLFIETLIENTKGEGSGAEQDFWIKAEKMLLMAIVGYIFYELDESEWTFESMVDILQLGRKSQNGANALDELFYELEEKNEKHFAVLQYNSYISGATETKQSIVISCLARLAVFSIKGVRELTNYDEMEIDKIGDRKTVTYIILPDTHKTYNFLASIMYTQMFNSLIKKADDEYGGRLPIHIRFLLDEFVNSGKVPNFENIISVIRSREMSVAIFLQSKAQLKAIYKDHTDTIIENCDSYIFLGGQAGETIKNLSEDLGKETIDMINTNDSRGMHPSHGVNFQITGRELMTKDEIMTMDGDRCILFLRGVRPFFSKKYDITKHKYYKYLSDFNKKNKFDINKFLCKERGDVVLDDETIIQIYELEKIS